MIFFVSKEETLSVLGFDNTVTRTKSGGAIKMVSIKTLSQFKGNLGQYINLCSR